MSDYVVISHRLVGFPFGTVLADTDLPDGVNVAALVSGSHLDRYEPVNDESET